MLDTRGAKLPASAPLSGPLWLTNGVRPLGAERWKLADDFADRTHDGRIPHPNVTMSSHECIAIRVSRRLKAIDVIDVLSN